MTALYVPPTDESDHKKQNQSLQLIGGVTSTNTTSIATNTAAITTLQGNRVGSVVVQKFTASGTYTPTSGMLYCIIEGVGSGGGGGALLGAASQCYSGGGGGSGGYSRLAASAATIGASQTVTIGNAGTGGTAGANDATAGADCSLGSLLIAKGGQPGLLGSVSVIPAGGAGGVAGTGDIVAAGAPGGSGLYNTTGVVYGCSPAGGSSFFGGGALGVSFATGTTTAGNNASNYGSGGGGAGGNATANKAGGNGSKGLIVVTEYVIA